MQLLDIKFISKTYSTSAIFGTFALYILGTRFTSAAYMQLFGIISTVVYMQLSSIKYILVSYITLALDAISADYI